ncbi:hypothetical protein BC828DRAFT_378874 [Blastocladiella britannica]|nr:hypothetical protein BC828DRAFT_378874 [Blastocladiella britannica]
MEWSKFCPAGVHVRVADMASEWTTVPSPYIPDRATGHPDAPLEYTRRMRLVLVYLQGGSGPEEANRPGVGLSAYEYLPPSLSSSPSDDNGHQHQKRPALVYIDRLDTCPPATFPERARGLARAVAVAYMSDRARALAGRHWQLHIFAKAAPSYLFPGSEMHLATPISAGTAGLQEPRTRTSVKAVRQGAALVAWWRAAVDAAIPPVSSTTTTTTTVVCRYCHLVAATPSSATIAKSDETGWTQGLMWDEAVDPRDVVPMFPDNELARLLSAAGDGPAAGVHTVADLLKIWDGLAAMRSDAAPGVLAVTFTPTTTITTTTTAATEDEPSATTVLTEEQMDEVLAMLMGSSFAPQSIAQTTTSLAACLDSLEVRFEDVVGSADVPPPRQVEAPAAVIINKIGGLVKRKPVAATKRDAETAELPAAAAEQGAKRARTKE